jgi:GNAT acetyltransferase-like protein
MLAHETAALLPDFSSQVHAYLQVGSGRPEWIPNLTTQVDIVGSGAGIMPVTINHGETGNSWVCSPHTAYVRYAREELRRLAHPLLAVPLGALCGAFGAYLWKSEIDTAVAINNWTLSTNLYPDLNRRWLREWIEEAQQRWPRHAIWFRSLNRRDTPEWLAQLASLGCELIPSRQVYLYDRIDLGARVPVNLHRDLKLLRSRRLEATEADSWTLADFERAAELYELLYMNKYSRLNPHYGAAFLRAWHAAGLLRLMGWRGESGELEAVVGIFGSATTLTAPIVGYDTASPPRRGLYRLLMAAVFELAGASGRRINLSAGAAHFKRLRGGLPSIEYSAVYARHLPANRRRAVRLLSRLATSLGEPLMRHFQW